MNKRGKLVFWGNWILGVLAIILLLNEFEKYSAICLLLETVILNYAITKGINYKMKDE